MEEEKITYNKNRQQQQQQQYVENIYGNEVNLYSNSYNNFKTYCFNKEYGDQQRQQNQSGTTTTTTTKSMQ